MNKIKVASLTDKGIREMNQDSHLVYTNKFGYTIAMVADGMGGHVGGQLASQFTVKTMKAYFKKIDFGSLTEEEIKHQLVKSIHFLSREFLKVAEKKPMLSDMGTTLNLNVFVDNVIYTLNVGDSRSSVIDKTGLHQISEDHNLAQLAKVDKRFAKFANDANLLTSSLGPNKETKVDVFKTTLQRDGYLIVTSDGIHQYVSVDFLVETMTDKKMKLAEKLQAIMDEAEENLTNDNVTIIGVEYGI